MKLSHALPIGDYSYLRNGSAGPLFTSGMLHLVILIIAIIGLPHMKHDLPIYDNSISVEIVQIDKKNQTTQEIEPEKKQSKPNPKKEDIQKKPPPPPTNKSEKPPKPVKPKPKPVVKEVKPNPLEKPLEVTEENSKNEEEQNEDFKALLKNLEEHEPVIQDGPLLTGNKEKEFIPLGERMTMNEQQAVLQRLGECWNIMAGARYAEELVVRMTIYMNLDRTIRKGSINNQLRYNTDSYFKAAADSALRALGHPNCRVLPLPIEKYEQWKEFTVTFDPREMLQ
jgi:hypothetical protein